jgi:hypothetical protein
MQRFMAYNMIVVERIQDAKHAVLKSPRFRRKDTQIQGTRNNCGIARIMEKHMQLHPSTQ